jgi:putative membrane protein
MEDQHNNSMHELTALANKKSITIPTSLTLEGQDAYKKLSTKSGKDFDKEYCSMMVKGHKNAIEMFEKASTDCNDPDIKAWAAETLPTLRTHLEHAIMCEKKNEKMS